MQMITMKWRQIMKNDSGHELSASARTSGSGFGTGNKRAWENNGSITG